MHANAPIKLAQQLNAKYGPLLTIDQLAEVLHRPPRGIAAQINRPEYAGLVAARRRIGRSIRFSSNEVADWIEGCAA